MMRNDIENGDRLGNKYKIYKFWIHIFKSSNYFN